MDRYAQVLRLVALATTVVGEYRFPYFTTPATEDRSRSMSAISENRSALRQFLASIASIGGDLSHITVPPFLLAQKSATEIPAAWCERPSILVAPALEPDAEKRALLVLKWYLSALRAQVYDSEREADGVKKPLNAFLGELFIAEWDDEMGKTKLISEQVR